MPSSPPLVPITFALLWGCSGGGGEAKDGGAEPTPTPPELPAGPLAEIPVVDSAWDPKAGDPSVPAELGGPGFTGEGWTTARISQIGDPKAPQGGSLSQPLPDWPATLRMHGQNWNTSFNYFVADVLYDTLLDYDPATLDLVPRLATHWQISEDKTTYRFRINPAAKWSDGKPVTAADVVATYKLYMDPTALMPSSLLTWGKFEEPKAVSPYIVEVKTKEENWRNFMYFGAEFLVLPAHEIGGITGTEYLDKYQFAYTAVSGPYEVRPEDIQSGQSITLTRRKDWWGESNPAWDGLYNFEELSFVVVQDEQLRFEKVKKGELDYFWVNKAQWWAEDVPKVEEVKRGMLVPRKFFTEAPIGTQGIAINTKLAPLDDLRVRKALQHLYDRDLMIEKLFYDEYEPLTSYFQSPTYANPNNPPMGYDELTAVELLEQAGWTEKDGEGYRTKDGRRLKFTLSYAQAGSERFLTLFQEACKKAGIQLELQLLTPATAWKNLQAKQYELHAQAWGGLIFPNPETAWKGELADQVDNNNVTSFKSARVDELLVAYDHEYDAKRRQEIIREIDGLIYEQVPYVLGWYGPSQRVVYWNKFGMPEWGVPRYLDKDDMFITWWVDPEREKRLEAARKDTAQKLEAPPIENRFWEAWVKAQSKGAGG